MKEEAGGLWEWLIPFAFIICAGWAVWHGPAYILDFLPAQSESLFAQISELHTRKDVTPNMAGLFGGRMDILDWLALIGMPVFFILGMRTIRVYAMEYQEVRAIDKVAMFIGRVTMMLILSMTAVMMYEVFLRYVIEAPTKWANELTLWIAGFVFLSSGLYAMQQRSHIRIFIIYDMMPRWAQRVCDSVSVLMIWVFASLLVYGSYNQVFVQKFYKWEMFGTAFDPPIPATIQPFILIIIVLVALQALVNLIADWNKDPEVHVATDIDDDELEAIKRSVGAD